MEVTYQLNEGRHIMSGNKKVTASRPTTGKRFTPAECKAQAARFADMVGTDERIVKDIALAVEDAHVLDFISPEEKSDKKLFGYKAAQIRHSKDTFRRAQGAMMRAILANTSGTSVFVRTADLLVEVANYWEKSGKKGPCNKMLVEKTVDGELVQELHDDATEGFVTAWGLCSNLQVTLPELRESWLALVKHADTKMTRWAEKTAKRTITVKQDVKTTHMGQPVTLKDQDVVVYADPVCRAYFEDADSKRKAESDRKSKLTDKQKGIANVDTQIKNIAAVIERLDVGKPAAGKWSDDSSVALNAAWQNVVAALEDVKVTMSKGNVLTKAQATKLQKSRKAK